MTTPSREPLWMCASRALWRQRPQLHIHKEGNPIRDLGRDEMNIDAIVDANATIGIDDVNRVSGVDEYHQLYRTVVFVEVSTIMKTF